ncbi:nucleoside hydrolase [Panacibacter ginsenosidivorans]|uniref:Nucleoside hydrolase n=1 Tax=Panacibacter ginsenosidivorans TaxID=1813871 RepID=A0A5B8V9H6_9BACT|nr:nucleoside hydrolase [Panacibacter ginsenosidivorans]QEC67899.1 nucleoside hydrolase [Panacibacter ginsenosidivorans]
MKYFLTSFFIVIIFGSFIEKQKPVSIIFDTDIAPDYDDVGAMALLHAFEDNGEAKILATISCNAFETTAPTLSVLNTYFNKPNIPIGITKNTQPNKDCAQQWAQAIVTKYPHQLKTNGEAEDAVKLYRKILSSQPDKSVTIITVGFFTNLAGLLNSTSDEYSPLNGKDLIIKKVKQLVSMSARIDSGKNSGYEFNVVVDANASQKVFNEWPTPWIMSGFEIGEKIHTGIRLINNESIQNSPVKDAFKIALAKDNNTIGRNSWDETAVLVAVRGLRPYFNFKKLNFKIEDDGKDIVIAGDKIVYLTFKQTPEEIAGTIEDLMMHQPKVK